MANLDQELLLDAETDAKAVAYIRTRLPQELKEKFSDEALYYFLDVLEEYYAESNLLDQEPDADGYVEIDLEAVAQYAARKAQKEGIGTFSPDDLLFVVQSEMDFQESLLEEEE